MLWRNEVQHQLVREPRCHVRECRAEGRDRDRRLRLSPPQLETVNPDVLPLELNPAAVEEYTQHMDRLAHPAREVRPWPVVPAAHDRRARRTQGHTHGSSGQRRHGRNTQRDRNRTADRDGERPHLQPYPLGLNTDRGGQRERVERRQLSHPNCLDTRRLRQEADLDRLLVGAVEPERQRDAELATHSIVVSVGCPSSSRPVSSHVDGLTWKCAVAVCASRKRRCNGEVS